MIDYIFCKNIIHVFAISKYNIDREWFHLRKDQVEDIIKEHDFNIVKNNKRYFDRIGYFR